MTEMRVNDEKKHSATILVVDDNPDIQTVLAISLEQFGYAVRTASDAKSALVEFENCTPDLAIIDFGLPDIHGIDLGAKIRRLPNGLNTKLVLLSGDHDADLAQQSSEIGFEAYLIKPVPMQQLLATLQALGLTVSN